MTAPVRAIAEQVITHPDSSRSSALWRDVLVCLSWANLAMLRIWSEVLTYTQVDAFYLKSPPRRDDVAAVMVSMLALGLLGGIAVQIVRRTRNERALKGLRWVAFGLWLIPLNSIRVLASGLPGLGVYLRQGLFNVIGVAGVYLVLILGLLTAFLIVQTLARHRVRIASRLALLAAPALLVTFGQGLFAIANAAPPIDDRPIAGPLANRVPSAGRVVWVIFDEWDYRLSFEKRHTTLDLRAIDRLRKQSIFATNAHSPARNTSPSVTSLLTGTQVTGIQPISRDDALVLPGGRRLRSMESVFSRARALGRNASVVGWYFPYCRVFGSFLADCKRWEAEFIRTSKGHSIGEKMAGQMRSLIETAALSPFGRSKVVELSTQTYLDMAQELEKQAADRSLDLVYCHMSVPHSPFIYDRVSDDFSRANSYIDGYIDALELVDRTVESLRTSMERAGTWEGTTLILSADHSFRNSYALDGVFDARVPFIVKAAGQNRGAEIVTRLETILTGDLVLKVLNGDPLTAETIEGRR